MVNDSAQRNSQDLWIGVSRDLLINAVRSLPEERAAELAARTLALPDAQSVEDLTALLTSAGER